MKRYISIFALVLSVVVFAPAQAPSDAVELTSLLNEFLAGAGKNDAAVHDRFWADDLIYTRSAGARTNKADLMKGVRSAPAAKDTDPVTVYTAEDIQIHQYGDAAVVAFKLVGTTTKSDGTKAVSNHLNTGTFIKRDGKWQAVAWQATTVPDPNAVKAASTTAKPAALMSSPSKSADGRVYQKGSRGGCFYLNSKGNKVYVDRSNCSQ
ncbi:MAG: nuclear transport factor 2 family protein [Pyrinomonadaceae bacterium]